MTGVEYSFMGYDRIRLKYAAGLVVISFGPLVQGPICTRRIPLRVLLKMLLDVLVSYGNKVLCKNPCEVPPFEKISSLLFVSQHVLRFDLLLESAGALGHKITGLGRRVLGPFVPKHEERAEYNIERVLVL